MAEQVDIVESVDKISTLPDAILRHILSLLPTKIAVSTCILSTRWRYLFPFSNNLDFDESQVFNPQRDEQSRNSHFLDFVDRCVMLMNDTHIDKFRLKCLHAVDTSHLNSWICATPMRNVLELDLCVPMRKHGMEPLRVFFNCSTLEVLKLGSGFSLGVPDSIYLPCLKTLHLDSIQFSDDISTQRLFSGCPVLEDLLIVGSSVDPLCVFTCTTLVVLKLGTGFPLDVPSSVCFPCLKSLHLESIEFLDDISTERLFSSCPVLEDLSIVACSMEYICELNLSSPSLKRLTMNENGPLKCYYKLVIDAPNLVYLEYTICIEGCTLKNMHSLSEAHINIVEPLAYWVRRTVPSRFPRELVLLESGHGSSLLEFLEGITSVPSLYLYGSFGEIRKVALGELPLFKNVTYLMLSCNYRMSLSMVIKLLHCCPNVQEFRSNGNIWGGIYDDERPDVPSCLSFHLKAILCKSFSYVSTTDGIAVPMEMESLEYFLKNANVLEVMRVYISSDGCVHEEIAEKLEKMVETVRKPGKPREIKFFAPTLTGWVEIRSL